MFDSATAIAILMGSFVFFIVIRLPITFTLAASVGLTMLYVNIPPMTLVQQMSKSVQSFSLMAIPFFIVTGEIMGNGGISIRLLKFASALVGRFRGGLAHVNVLASMMFGGLSGSAIADISSLGAIQIPMMVKAGFDRAFACAITVVGACQAVIIPPSHNLIIFSLAAGGVSIGSLFIAGIIPGILCGVILMATCVILARVRHYPKGEPIGFKQMIVITRDALLALFTAVIIIVGIRAGVFTATESAAIAAIYAYLIAVFYYHDLKMKQLPKLLMNTVKTMAMVFSLIATAGAFGWMLAFLKIPTLLTQFLLDVTESKILLLIMMNIILLLLGCIMDMAPLILITTPILLPVATSIGMSPIQFGIMLIFNLAVGLCTPPVGTALFVGCSIGKIPIETVVKSMIPLYIAMLVCLALIIFVPDITLWMPSLSDPAIKSTLFE